MDKKNLNKIIILSLVIVIQPLYCSFKESKGYDIYCKIATENKKLQSLLDEINDLENQLISGFSEPINKIANKLREKREEFEGQLLLEMQKQFDFEFGQCKKEIQQTRKSGPPPAYGIEKVQAQLQDCTQEIIKLQQENIQLKSKQRQKYKFYPKN